MYSKWCVLYDTFSSTCLALGLIEDDDEWRRALSDGALWKMPQSLRRLFVRILIHCQPINPHELWNEFKDKFSEDYSRNFGTLEAQSKAFFNIKSLLSEEGYSLKEFPSLECIEKDYIEIEFQNDNIFNHNENIIGAQNYDLLNIKQKEIVDYVLNMLHNSNESSNKCIYIDGPGGCGKTFLYQTLYFLIKNIGRHVCNMAFTGIAATLLPNGKTVHKVFGLPVPLYSDSSSSIKVNSKEGEFLKKIDVFIWDEAPMAPKYALKIMDRTLRDIMKSNIPFGGKIVILGGDFRQILPIKEKGTKSEIINLSIKFSKVWKFFLIYSLTENIRALPEEKDFIEFLLSVGNGSTNDDNDIIKLPERIIAPRFDELSQFVILSARNADVDEINKRVVQLLDSVGETKFTSIDSTENCGNDNNTEVILPEYLHSLSPPSLPPYELKLRINTVVILIRNLSINEGLCNGTRLLIKGLSNNLLQCEILTGDKKGKIVFLNRISLYCENIYPFTFKRRQFPIKLAFAMTINKAQGQTFKKISLDLKKDVFNQGQLYVAISRVRSYDSVKIYLGSQRSESNIKNYVYKEIFQ